MVDMLNPMSKHRMFIRVGAAIAAMWTGLGAPGTSSFGPGAAFAAPIVSYVFTVGVDAYGTNGAGYSQGVLAAPWEFRLAYDTRMILQVGTDGTRVYTPGGPNQIFMELKIAGDTYRAGPTTAVGSIGVTRNAANNTNTLAASFSPTSLGQPNLQFVVTYPGIAGQPLPMTLPASSFQFDTQVSIVRLFRTTGQDFYYFQVGNIRPALSPFCPPDFNLSGGVSVQDIFDFLAAWFALNPLSDFNGTGGVTVQDIFDFLGAWFQGC